MLIALLSLLSPALACGPYGALPLMTWSDDMQHQAVVIDDTVVLSSEEEEITLRQRDVSELVFTEEGLLVISEDRGRTVLYSLDGEKLGAWRQRRV